MPAPLLSAISHNKIDELTINFQNKIIQLFCTKSIFDDATGLNSIAVLDGISLPSIPIWTILLVWLQDSVMNKANMPNGILGVIGKAASTFCQGKSGKKHDEDFLRELNSRFTIHSAFRKPSSDPHSAVGLFTINHYAGNCT